MFHFNAHNVCTNPKTVAQFGDKTGAAYILIKVCERDGLFYSGCEAQSKTAYFGSPVMSMINEGYATEKDAALSTAVRLLDVLDENFPYRRELEIYYRNLLSALF